MYIYFIELHLIISYRKTIKMQKGNQNWLPLTIYVKLSPIH